MRLVYYRGTDGVTNFGDELNVDVWRHHLPGAFEEDDGVQFIGIGTLLNDRLPEARRTVVFGSGVGYYGPPRRDERWTVYCVRGPLSAEALGLPRSDAIADPAILVARMPLAPLAAGDRWSHAFMPHWQSAPDEWAEVCGMAGMGFIDPRWPTGRVLESLRRTGVLLTEAMHGAIVADALRIPWIAVRTRSAIKTFKWEDWCRSMDLEYQPRMLPPVWPKVESAGALRSARGWARRRLAAALLARTARRARPTLSAPGTLAARLDALEGRLDVLRRDEALSNSRFHAASG